MPLRRRHVVLIAQQGTRHAVRGGVGIAFLLLSLTFGLLVAHTFVSPVEMMMNRVVPADRDSAEAREVVVDDLVDQARPAVAWVLGTDASSDDPEERAAAHQATADWVGYLLDERPALLSAILLVLLCGWPFVVVCGAFDLYAGDIARRRLRYQLLRTDRGSIFVGRLAGMVATLLLVLLLLMGTVVVYIGVKLPFYGWGALLGWGGYGVLALAVASLPYIALTAWISSATGSGMVSLTISSLIVGAVPMFAMVGRLSWEPAGNLAYLLPWGYQQYLFHPSAGACALAGAGCVAMTAVFGGLGYRNFSRRDL